MRTILICAAMLVGCGKAEPQRVIHEHHFITESSPPRDPDNLATFYVDEDGSIVVKKTDKFDGGEVVTEWTAPSVHALKTDEELSEAWKVFRRAERVQPPAAANQPDAAPHRGSAE